MKYPTINIDWQLLAKASEYYTKTGFKQVEVPYAVPKFYSGITKPHNDESFILDKGMFKHDPYELVGSAEQGFIFQLLMGDIQSNAKLQAITPCFRVEKYDMYHQPWFMKLELFHFSDRTQDLHDMIDMTRKFFNTNTEKFVEIHPTSHNSYDIEIMGVEIGSYGFRTIEDKTFIYGTGLALPRFSMKA